MDGTIGADGGGIRPLVRVEAVHRHFLLGDAAIDALAGVSMAVERGEFLAVWGPSGSGKSTLMNILGLIDFPSSGEVWFDGVSTKSLGDRALTAFRGGKVGFVFQTFNLVPVLTAIENVMLPLEIRGVGEEQARACAADALRDVGLAKFGAALPDRLSGGQRQRVAIARALAVKPDIVIADEPTANLDSGNSRMVVELMREMNRSHGVTIVFSTHDPCLLEQADRRVLLHDGRIVRDEASS